MCGFLVGPLWQVQQLFHAFFVKQTTLELGSENFKNMIKNYYKLIVALLFATNVFGQNLPSYLPKDGLVGWWPFNGNANDESGNGNHGKVNGAILSEDRNGKQNSAYSFDGVLNHIRIINSNTLNNKSVSINGWFITTNLATDDFKGAKGIVSKWWQSPSVCNENYNAYLICLTKPFNENQTVLGAATDFYAGNSFTSNTIYEGKWTHFVFTHNNLIGGKLYINGILVNSNNVKGEICSSINDLIFGADIENGNIYRNFNGQLDDIAIYNRALTEAEIQSLYTGTPLCTTPPTPKVNPTVTTCAGNSISFEATGATGVEKYNWYDVAEGGTPITTSQIFKTPVLNYGENKTYWVSITNGVCESARARVDVVVKELPTVKKLENYSVCAGEFIQAINFAVSPQGATNYWSNDNLAIGLQKNGMGAIPGFVSQNSTGTPLVSNITVTPSFNGCIGKSETFKIYVIPTPKVAITNLKPIVFTSDAPIALVGEPTGGTFTGEAIVGTIFTPAKATLGKKSIEYKYVSKDGCGGIATASTIVVDTNGVVCTKYDTITVKETIYDTVLKITFKLTTGINISKTTSLTVYPNPTADNLIIDAADVAEMNGYRYQLMDALGKEIYSQLVTSKKTEISLKTLGAKGVYVLHVLDANNQSVVNKKIILE